MEKITDLFGNDDTEAIYQQALAMPLAEKIEIALLTIRNYEQMALKLSDDGFYVCFSGGKDSTVVAQAVFEALLQCPPSRRNRSVCERARGRLLRRSDERGARSSAKSRAA